MPEHDHERHPEVLHSVLDAAEPNRVHSVAGVADHEQLAESEPSPAVLPSG